MIISNIYAPNKALRSSGKKLPRRENLKQGNPHPNLPEDHPNHHRQLKKDNPYKSKEPYRPSRSYKPAGRSSGSSGRSSAPAGRGSGHQREESEKLTLEDIFGEDGKGNRKGR